MAFAGEVADVPGALFPASERRRRGDMMRDREVRDVVVVEDEGELLGILTDRLDVTRPRPRSMRS